MKVADVNDAPDGSVAASVKVLEESATPDVQCIFAPGSFKNGQIGELEETPGLSAGAWQMRPLSRGYVEGDYGGGLRRKHPAKAAMGWLSGGSGSGFA